MENMIKIKVLLIVMFLLSGCPSNSYTKTSKGNFDYFEIDGMTCLQIRDGTQFSGLTCNWDQWNGKTSVIVKEIENPQ